MKKKDELYSMRTDANQRAEDYAYITKLSQYWDESLGSNIDKLRAFTKYVPYSEFPKLFAKYEIFKKVLQVHGSIVECGVHLGGGLMTWALLSSIFEPVNHGRKVIGFDTFEGFTGVNDKDIGSTNSKAMKGGLEVNSFEDISRAVSVFDGFRPLGHIQKVELVRGDALVSIKEYLDSNPQLVISLLYLDFDLYEPTKKAIELLSPRMPKGSVIVFDELNIKEWPGETVAVQETLGLSNLKIERFTFQPQISYAVID